MSPKRILPGSAGVPDHELPASDEVEEVKGVDDGGTPVAERVGGDGAIDEGAIDDRAIDAWVEANGGTSVSQDAGDGVDGSPAPEHAGLFRRIYYGETRIDFVRRKRIWFAFSIIVICAGALSLGIRGLNFGIDFVGGTSWTVPSKTVTVQQANAAIGGLIPDPQTTILGVFGSSSRTIDVEAKLPQGQSASTQSTIADEVSAKLASVTHQSVNNVAVESVGPSWGSQITHKALVALIVFFILIALYISIFFEWRMAIAAIVAVLHDIAVTVGIYSLSGFEVTPDTVVAFLTILGYSLYDTIVVFDRVRDNAKNLSVRDRITFSDVVNLSMNQTLARSINTSLVAIMPILAMLVLGAEILGASTLQFFGLALLVGLTTGAYSSIFIASPMVAIMKEREPKYRIIRERLALRGNDRVLLSASAVARGTFGLAPEGRGQSPARASAARSPRPSSQPSRPSRSTPARRSSRGKPKGGRR